MKHFVLFITFLIFISCSTNQYNVSKIEGRKIEINQELPIIAEFETFIKPYRDHINKDLDSVLAFAPETLDKSKGQWQTNIGNFMADVCFEKASILFEKRHQKKIDICLLNHGGIRSIIPKGSITSRTAFEVMPFENSINVIALKGAQIEEMATYLISEKKPHPVSGLKININASNEIISILVNDKTVNKSQTYYVATSDYLSNGGDNMTFFQKNEGVFDLDYKIRNVLIDHFKEVDTLKVSTEKRIIIN
ncbi:MAG: 5'-nucleotidase [Flavobacterium sp.]|nr:5'-nucleotidase [Flavobacterium sp.]